VAVRAEHAFAAPEVLAQFVQEMRGKAEQLHATAVLLIAPKAAVQFPQVCCLADVERWLLVRYAENNDVEG
jgi:hypothetical protein